MTNTTSKTILTAVAGTLVSAAPFLPMPWAILAATLGGLLGGGAHIRRPGDVRVVDVGKVKVPR